MTEDLKRRAMMEEYAELLGQLHERKHYNRLDNYQPTEKQAEFHNCPVRQRLLMAANQCITPSTLIQTPGGEVLIEDKIGVPGFDVVSWDGEQARTAQAGPVFLKGIEPAFRCYLGNGRVFECSRKHRVWSNGEWIELDQLVRISGALRCWRPTLGWTASCDKGNRRDGEQPLRVGDIDQSLPPSPDGAPNNTLWFGLADEVARILAHTRIDPMSGRLTISADGSSLLSALTEKFPGPISSRCVERKFDILREVRQSQPGSSQFQGGLEGLRGRVLVASDNSIHIGSQLLYAIEPIGARPIVDFQVPNLHCYMAAGVPHHNSGKSYSASMELAYHMTGLYPEWWEGYRFTTPTNGWAAGVTRESTRDNPQRLLLGEGRDWGSGAIPKHLLVGHPSMVSGIPDTVDGFQVRHVSGGVSSCHFKSYERGREKFQGATLHWFWGDEEMPWPIYSEALTRLNRHRGLFLMTFTPLLGMTEVVRTFVEPQDTDQGREQRAVVHMDISEATFYDEAEIEDIIAQYPEHERRARTQGLPLLGEGLVYPVPDDLIMTEPFPIPDHYRKVSGVDFGGASATGHFFAGAMLAYDPDTDIVYLYDTLKQRGTTIAENASALKKRGCDKIPVAWPHDGEQADPGSGRPLASLYEDEGLYMLSMSARYDDKTGGRQAKEPVIADLLIRMQTNRFKVFSHLLDFFKEKAMYHRKDGKVVPEFDDLISAVHYAYMMLRYSSSRAEMVGLEGGAPKSYLDGQGWLTV